MTNFCLDCCIRLKFQNCQISSALDLLMRPAGMVFQWAQFPVSRIHRTSFKSFKIHEFRDKRKLMPSRYVSVSSITGWWQLFTTNGVENSVSFHCLTFFFLLWMLKNTFTTFPVSSQVFWCLEHTTNCFIFSKSGLKYPKPLQSLLSMNQVNLFKS